MFEQAMKESRLERAQSEVRIAKLKTAIALEEAGRHEESEAIVAEVRAEQERVR